MGIQLRAEIQHYISSLTVSICRTRFLSNSNIFNNVRFEAEHHIQSDPRFQFQFNNVRLVEQGQTVLTLQTIFQFNNVRLEETRSTLVLYST